MTKNGGASKRGGGLPGRSVDARYLPSLTNTPPHRGLIAPARAGSIVQLLCTMRTPRARRSYTDCYTAHYKSTYAKDFF